MTALRLLPELEDALCALPGVTAVSIVTGPDAQPVEVHVLAASTKPAKQIVRDVQSLAMASYGLALDHRIVSVVQIDDPSAAAAPSENPVPASAPRPSLTSITVHSRAGEAEVTVALSIDGLVFTGTSIGPASPGHRQRIVAEATLRAVEELLGVPAHIDSAQTVAAGDREVALVVLTLVVPRMGEQAMCGSALVRADADDATARAVLSSINRRLAG